jgi:serine/threonine protein kinase
MNAGIQQGGQTDEHPLLGRTLRGTYRVTRLLDRGGMGLVFEAEHERLKRRFAVKVLPRHLARDAHALARFRREAEIAALLQHPHVVQIVDFDTTDQQEPYIVMELLTGESLAHRLARQAKLPLSVAVKIACQAASGLMAVHQAGIVHRDLKPGNVFLTEVSGQGEFVKLLDFGISKGSHGGQGLTGEYDVLGTPDYMAPEQALGRTASADQRSDQYSLAVIVYEMLAGRVPFIGDTEINILSQVVADEPPALDALAPEVPARVAACVRRALSKLPEDRFETIDDFASALAQGAGVSLPPASPHVGATLRLTSDPTVLSQRDARLGAARPSAPPAREPHPHTGLRARAPRREATVPSIPSLERLRSQLGRAARAHAAGDSEQAAKLVEQALMMGELLGDEGATQLAQAASLLRDVLETRIGSLTRRLKPKSATPDVARKLSPEEAFVLSNADGQITVEEIIDLSPLSRLQTLRFIARLLQSGGLV